MSEIISQPNMVLMRIGSVLTYLCSIYLGWCSNYYVDNSLTNSLNSGTSWANAWTNFSSIVWYNRFSVDQTGIRHGDNLYLSGGTTSQTYKELFTCAGNDPTNSGYITICPGIDAGHNGQVICDGESIRGGVNLAGVTSIKLSGQESSDQQRHWIFQNMGSALAYNANHSVTYGGGVNTIIEYLECTNCINGPTLSSATNCIVRFCKILGVTGNGGVFMAGSAGYQPELNWVHDCEISCVRTNWLTGAGADGVQMAYCTTVSNCLIYAVLGTETWLQHQDGIQHNGSSIKVVNCTFINMGNSACESNGDDSLHVGCTNITFINNLAYWNIPQVTNHTLSGYSRGFEWVPHIGQNVYSNYLVANNTIVDIPSFHAISFSFAVTNGTAFQNMRILNNLIVNCGDSNSPTFNEPISIGTAGSSGTNIDYSQWTIDNNLIVSGVLGTDGIWMNTGLVSQVHAPVSVAGFKSYAWIDPNNDYHLTASSGAINAAVVIPEFNYDKDLVTRYNWDVGAYQFLRRVMTINGKATFKGKATIR